ncbi:MAG TPA: cyclic nucleotide-binding domain-containing protein [Dehalococcoidia bacterium]|jgi:CRP-like cAMP-binding protein
MDAAQTLAKAALFRGMSEEYLQRLARAGRERNYSPGETILREGDPGIAFFVINTGRCEVLRGSGPDQQVINQLGPGDSFGEMALLNDLPRMATVRAVDNVSCLALLRLDLLDALRDQPEIAIYMLKTLSQLLRRAEERAT